MARHTNFAAENQPDDRQGLELMLREEAEMLKIGGALKKFESMVTPENVELSPHERQNFQKKDGEIEFHRRLRNGDIRHRTS
ncbi:hypothetical protein EMCG_05606 [[Emmonsia] crescens]|uniref:Uncharacterized protein n=1 Tax=[Emmonsia] crescens TaxID=73230 RepID=A0A0G2IDN9_9EURO|nr:hypothetical protein EMCG_05606 [Emmonsia crescens UAMH 3008]